MTALLTASAVLAWAVEAEGQAPVGSVADAGQLASPDLATQAGLQYLARCSAARLGAGRPPLGDRGPVGLGALFLAASIGGRADRRAATSIARAVPPLRLEAYVRQADDPHHAPHPSWADAVTRHGVAGRFAHASKGGAARGSRDRYLVECLLDASPLTAILLRPSAERIQAETTGELTDTALRMLGRPRGRQLLTSVIAVPTRDAAVLAWRARLLTRLVSEDRDAALSVYLNARLQHSQQWDELLARAAGTYGIEEDLDSMPRAALLFWAPLAVMNDEDPALLPSQPFLRGYRRAVELGQHYLSTTTTTS